MQSYEIYTDGSAKGRWGSWAYLIYVDGQVICEASGRVKKTDCNRMEFQAAINALAVTPESSKVTIYTDSRVLIENVPQFSVWRGQNWVKKNNRPIPNVDLFQALDRTLQSRTVLFKWIKAHSGHVYNERCDELCRIARDQTPHASNDRPVTLLSSRA